jgi:hypothetical protein
MLISIGKLNSFRQVLTEVSVGYKDNSNKINPKSSPGIEAFPIGIFHRQRTVQTRYVSP